MNACAKTQNYFRTLITIKDIFSSKCIQSKNMFLKWKYFIFEVRDQRKIQDVVMWIYWKPETFSKHFKWINWLIWTNRVDGWKMGMNTKRRTAKMQKNISEVTMIIASSKEASRNHFGYALFWPSVVLTYHY